MPDQCGSHKNDQSIVLLKHLCKTWISAQFKGLTKI